MLIPWHSTSSLQDEIDALNNDLSEVQESISDLDSTISEYEERVDTTEHLIDNCEEISECGELNYLIRNFLKNSDTVKEWKSELRRYRNEMDECTEREMDIENQIEEKENQKAEMEGNDVQLDTDEIEKKLSRNPHFKSLMARDDTLLVVLKGLEMMPMYNNWEDTIKMVNPVPLGEITLRFKAGEKVQIFTTEENRAAGLSARYVAHPHILANNVPCLGDFESLIAEAVIDGNIVEATELLVAFLETCNPSDYAGRTWINWVLQNMDYAYRNIDEGYIKKRCLHPEHRESAPIKIEYMGPNNIKWAYKWEGKWYDEGYIPDYAEEIAEFENRERLRVEKEAARKARREEIRARRLNLLEQYLMAMTPRPLQSLAMAEARFA